MALLACVFSMQAASDVKISNLQDFHFGLYSGFGNLLDDDNICINTIPVSRYDVVFWGSGPAGAFEISNGVDSLAYQIRFNHRPRSQGGRSVSPGVPLTNRRNATDSLDCLTGLNANIQVRFQRADLQAANPGRYNGTLTVTVTPE